MLRTVHSDEGLSIKIDRDPAIFLAGPSPRGRGDGFPSDWRDEAFAILKDRNFTGRVFVPRPSTGNSTTYDGQIEWELHHLGLADVIMFWVPRKAPDMMGITTNAEYGLYVKSDKVVYGRPDDALQIRYLDFIGKKFADITPTNTLESTIDAAIALANKRSKEGLLPRLLRWFKVMWRVMPQL
jgi:hypothetical protein